MSETRRFKNIGVSGASYVVVSCNHAAHTMRRLGLLELSTIDEEEVFLTVAIAPCPSGEPGCLKPLLDDAKQLHRQMGCQIDIALFCYENGDSTVLHLNPETLGPVDELLPRIWSGLQPEFLGRQMEMVRRVAIYDHSGEDARIKSPAELAQDIEEAQQANPPCFFLSIDLDPVGHVAVCEHLLHELSPMQLATRVKEVIRPSHDELILCSNCQEHLMEFDLKVFSKAEITDNEERTQRMAQWLQTRKVEIVTRVIDGHAITLVVCAHLTTGTKAKALEIVAGFLKTRSCTSLVGRDSRVIVCLDCPEHHRECVKKQDQVATHAAVDLGLQFFIVIQFESHDNDGKPVDWLLIKNILQPAEPHEVFEIVQTADPPQVHTAEESMAPDSRTEIATKVAPKSIMLLSNSEV